MDKLDDVFIQLADDFPVVASGRVGVDYDFEGLSGAGINNLIGAG